MFLAAPDTQSKNHLTPCRGELNYELRLPTSEPSKIAGMKGKRHVSHFSNKHSDLMPGQELDELFTNSPAGVTVN